MSFSLALHDRWGNLIGVRVLFCCAESPKSFDRSLAFRFLENKHSLRRFEKISKIEEASFLLARHHRWGRPIRVKRNFSCAGPPKSVGLGVRARASELGSSDKLIGDMLEITESLVDSAQRVLLFTANLCDMVISARI